MPNFVRKYWIYLSVLGLGLMLILIIPRVSNYLSTRAARRADAAATQLRDEAARADARAQAAEAKEQKVVEELRAKQSELEEVKSQLANLQGRLNEARNDRSNRQKTYEAVRGVAVAGAVDATQLCADLARLGYPCTEH